MPVCIEKSGDLVRCFKCQENDREIKSTKYRATRLFYGLKFKLSHMIEKQMATAT